MYAAGRKKVLSPLIFIISNIERTFFLPALLSPNPDRPWIDTLFAGHQSINSPHKKSDFEGNKQILWWKDFIHPNILTFRWIQLLLFPRYGPLWWVLLCAMGHYGVFGCALWATAAALFIHYGPLQRIWLCPMGHCTERSHTVKICIDFCAMGHNAGFGYALWTIAQGLVIHYGPWWRIWWSAIGRVTVFGDALWAIAQNQLPQRRTRQQFLKACHIL
jgi:hypothetical protein